ncbi:WD40/YVTN/BNR-like repeat-containing protein [Delftia acidovorans]|jgi:photosystem II stability/assembly factor-like uncharacterized protein|uniref:WD40/YVTN/BNR-like repeat-containing protein n=1 Tax=Delftia acidovorans TaxID=80866 RepID=UPI0028509572|nr:glycosyl hydrolase [Delftia acidovorans]
MDEVKPVPAMASAIATQAAMLGSTWAGTRAVAVGDRGVVLLSDDGGARWRQARSVPVSFTLTSVSFADAQHGWAVGHGGTVIVTRDGGETWRVQRVVTTEDRPLFSVHFFDANSGVAVGLWSLVLVTSDGGETWQERPLQPMPGARKADLNLLGLFAGTDGVLFAAAERGQVLRSDDRGATWTYLSTGYSGSLWCGAVLADGALLVGGQRGTLLRSEDHGQTWKPLRLDTKSSVTGIAAAARGVTLVGLDGLLARSGDGRDFTIEARPDGVAITSTLATPRDGGGQALLFTRRGVVRGGGPP